MNIVVNKGNALQHIGSSYKTLLDRGAKRLTPEGLQTVADGFKTVKYDGELHAIFYERNSGAKAYSAGVGGKVRDEFPALHEFEQLCKLHKITQIIVMAELYATDAKGLPLKFPEVVKELHNRDAKNIRIAVFDLWSLNSVDKMDRSYLERYEYLRQIFSGKLVHPVASEKSKEINRPIMEWALSKGYEGLVVRQGNKIYKVKPAPTVDAVIYAFDKMGKRMQLSPKQISAVFIGFVFEKGGKKYLLTSGKVGTGWSDQERKALYEELSQQVYKDESHQAYVKLEHIIEVGYMELQPVGSKTAYPINDDMTLDLSDPIRVESQSLRHPRRITYREGDKVGDYPMISDHPKQINAIDLSPNQAADMQWAPNPPFELTENEIEAIT